jgi:phospholipase C
LLFGQAVLNALWSNPELWRKTVVLIDYDENDGFFDHVVPPVAPAGTPGEFVGGLPTGLGPRVPMTVVSPWSRGGWVNSQVFDHTSVLRFIETWTGVRETNISAWRRAICGDLISCFDFAEASTVIPVLPDTAALRRKADQTQTALPAPTPPAAGAQTMPAQEPGVRPARPLPYQLTANGAVSADHSVLTVTMANSGSAAMQFRVHRHDGRAGGPWVYDVAPEGQARDSFPVYGGKYDLAVHGPNGFLYVLAGDAASTGAGVEVDSSIDERTLRLLISNSARGPVVVTVSANAYGGAQAKTFRLSPGERRTQTWDPVRSEGGWYDLTVRTDVDPAFQRRFVGHIETGEPSVTG